MMNKTDLESLLTQISEHCREIESHQHVIRKIVGTIAEKLILDGEENIQQNDFEVVAGQEMAKDGDFRMEVKTNPNIKGDNFQIQNNRGEVLYDSEIDYTKMKRMQISDSSSFVYYDQNGINKKPIPCQICGNIKKTVTKIKEGYYCNGCQNDLMPDYIQPGEAVKRKHCFKCSNRLPGFFKIEDTSPVWCEKCTGEI
jgi:hypothetical protein